MSDAGGIDAALLVAGSASAVAAALHVATIAGGPAWYRFMGAGEGMARAAEAGKWQAAAITAAIATVLALWSAYAFTGAGWLALPLPWVRPALCAITAVYLLRGAVLVPVLLMPTTAATAFGIWSSMICLGIGLAHLVGLVRVWPRLG